MAIDISDVTNDANTGTFDKLMAAVDCHVNAQFAAQRIQGKEYAQVYLGSIQTTVEQGIQFLVQQQQVALIEQQVKVAEQDVKVKEQEVLKSQKEVEIADITKGKVEAERDLLQQRLITERAETQDNIASSGSVKGRQIALYKAQTDGFARDAEQKVMKQMMDWYIIQFTNNPQLVVSGATKLQDSTVGEAVKKAMAGIGVSV